MQLYKFRCQDTARNMWSQMMRGAVCLAKFKYYPDVHDKQRYDLGLLLGHCRAQAFQLMESQRCVFINWNYIM